MSLSSKYSVILCLLTIGFAIYNTLIYYNKAYGTVCLSKEAQEGEKLWLQNNCNSCHQLYGLGGYLGPDLTNEYSKASNERFLKAMFNSGIKTMPQFHFNENEKKVLVQFLKEIDKTGYYPNLKADIQYNGWVRLDYKNVMYDK